MKLETIKIKAGDGYAIINKSDFDKNKGHKVYAAPKTKPAPKTDK